MIQQELEHPCTTIVTPVSFHNRRSAVSPTGYPFVVMTIPTAELTYHPNYQRALNKMRVKKMASPWRPDLAGALIVNWRPDGTIVVVDGQHRAHAAILAGIYEVLCHVYDLPYEAEAQLFNDSNSSSIRLSPLQRFAARIEAKDEHALTMRELCAKWGFTLGEGGHHRPTTIRCIEAIESSYRFIDDDGAATGKPRHGVLNRVLRLLSPLWPDDKIRVSDPIIRAFDLFVRTYPELDDSYFIQKLRVVDPASILRRATLLNNGSQNSSMIAYVLWEHYNKGLKSGSKTRLPNRLVAKSED